MVIFRKISEIKNSTIDETKPRSISLLQKALVVVFLLTMTSASIMLGLSLQKSTLFYANLDTLENSKLASVRMMNAKILLRDIVNIANGVESNESDIMSRPVSDFLMEELNKAAEEYRQLRNNREKEISQQEDDYKEFQRAEVEIQMISQSALYYNLSMSAQFALLEIVTECLDLSQ